MFLSDFNSNFSINDYNSGRRACLFFLAPKRERGSTFIMATRNEELMHECFPKDSRIETARKKEKKKMFIQIKNI